MQKKPKNQHKRCPGISISPTCESDLINWCKKAATIPGSRGNKGAVVEMMTATLKACGWEPGDTVTINVSRNQT